MGALGSACRVGCEDLRIVLGRDPLAISSSHTCGCDMREGTKYPVLCRIVACFNRHEFKDLTDLCAAFEIE